jgi:hypothetical protein
VNFFTLYGAGGACPDYFGVGPVSVLTNVLSYCKVIAQLHQRDTFLEQSQRRKVSALPENIISLAPFEIPQ